MLDKLAKLIRGYWLAAVIGAALFAGGYTAATVHQKIAQAEAHAAASEKIVTQERKIYVDRAVRNVAVERKLQAEVDQLRDERETLKEALNAKPDPDADVCVRLGDVRLLNAAATGLDPGADPAREPAYQEQACSDLTQRPFIGAEVDLRVQYRELAKRHDALVDWVETEIISPQVSK